MNHFQNTHLQIGPQARQTPQAKPSSVTTAPIGLSQAELRDIVLAILG